MPIASTRLMTAAGGGAPAVMAWIGLGSPFFISSGALAKVLRTMGAPQKWVTCSWRMRSSTV